MPHYLPVIVLPIDYVEITHDRARDIYLSNSQHHGILQIAQKLNKGLWLIGNKHNRILEQGLGGRGMRGKGKTEHLQILCDIECL